MKKTLKHIFCFLFITINHLNTMDQKSINKLAKELYTTLIEIDKHNNQHQISGNDNKEQTSQKQQRDPLKQFNEARKRCDSNTLAFYCADSTKGTIVKITPGYNKKLVLTQNGKGGICIERFGDMNDIDIQNIHNKIKKKQLSQLNNNQVIPNNTRIEENKNIANLCLEITKHKQPTFTSQYHSPIRRSPIEYNHSFTRTTSNNSITSPAGIIQIITNRKTNENFLYVFPPNIINSSPLQIIEIFYEKGKIDEPLKKQNSPRELTYN